MRVKILKTDNRIGVKKGEIYQATGYKFDPEKMTLLSRIPDGYDPECNEYKHNLAFYINKAWMVIDNSGKYVLCEH